MSKKEETALEVFHKAIRKMNRIREKQGEPRVDYILKMGNCIICTKDMEKAVGALDRN